MRQPNAPLAPVEVTGIWLDAHSERITVRAEIAGEWRTIIEAANVDGHISHIVEPGGMLKAPPYKRERRRRRS